MVKEIPFGYFPLQRLNVITMSVVAIMSIAINYSSEPIYIYDLICILSSIGLEILIIL
jgi:hypothetical protein